MCIAPPSVTAGLFYFTWRWFFTSLTNPGWASSFLCVYSCIFLLIPRGSLSDSSSAFPLHTCSVLFYGCGFLSVRAVSSLLSFACWERVIVLTLPKRSYMCSLNTWLIVLPPTSSFFLHHNGKTSRIWVPEQASRGMCGGKGSGCLHLV